jgi:hypothetical protein
MRSVWALAPSSAEPGHGVHIAPRAELEAAFAMRWADIEAFGDVRALPGEARSLLTRREAPG